jgi:hypothetical protein
VKAAVPTPPGPSTKSVTAAPHQSKVSVSKKGGAAANASLKTTKGLRQVQVKNTQEKVKAGKSSPKILNPTTPTPAPQITQSPIEEISVLLDTLPSTRVWSRRFGSSQRLTPSFQGRPARGQSSKSLSFL